MPLFVAVASFCRFQIAPKLQVENCRDGLQIGRWVVVQVVHKSVPRESRLLVVLDKKATFLDTLA